MPDVAVIARENTARLLYSDPSESEKTIARIYQWKQLVQLSF